MFVLLFLFSNALAWDLKYDNGCYWSGDYYCKEYYSYSYDCWPHGRKGYGTYSCPGYYSFIGEFSNDYPTEGTFIWERSNRSYTGGWYNWRFSGVGTLTEPDGTTLYSDGWYGSSEEFCGKVACDYGNTCVLTYPDGKQFKGSVDVEPYCSGWVNDTILEPKNGTGTVIYGDHTIQSAPGSGFSYVKSLVFTGTIKDGYPNGEGYIKSTVNDYEYTGGFSSSGTGFYYQGQGKLKYNGATYEGGWKDNKTHGAGVFTDSTGCVRTGEWKGGIDVGQATLICPDGLDFKGKTHYFAEEETYRPFEGEGTKFINGDKYYFISSNGTEIKTNKLGLTYSAFEFLEKESGVGFFKSMKEGARGCSTIRLDHQGWIGLLTGLMVFLRRKR